MVAAPLNPTTRFIGLKNLHFYWVPTIADKTAPTRLELDAGIDLSNEINTADGWAMDEDIVDAPDLGSGFTAQLDGSQTADDSSLMIYMSKTAGDGDDIRTILHPGDVGFVVRFDTGDVEDSYMDVWPCAVKSMKKSPGANDPATVTVNFRITAPAAENVSVPAA